MKKILVSILLAVVLSIFAVSVTGCHGCGETTAERSYDHSAQLKVNGSMMVDDWDMFWETDHPSRLTEFTVR